MTETRGSMTGMRRMAGLLAVAGSLVITGTGVVTGQSPSAGARPFEGRTLRIMVDALRENWDAKYWTQPFEDATGATIEWTYVPFEGLDAKYASLVASGDASYDAITAIVTTAPAFREILFTDLAPLVDPALIADLRAADRVGDKVYSYGIFDGAHLFYWNQDAFKQAGLDPDKAPESFDELFAACDALKTAFPDKACFDWEMSDPNTTFAYWALLLNAAGGQMYNDDLTKVAFDGPEGLAAIKTLDRIFDYADPAGYQIPSQLETGNRFAQGDTLVNFNWDNADKQIMQNADSSKIAGKVGLGIIPGVGGNRSGSINGWEGYGINAKSPNQDLAAAWVEYTLSHDAQLTMARELGLGTGRVSFITDPDFANDRSAQVVAEQVQYPVGRYGSGFSSAVNEVFDVVLNQLRQDQLTPEEALAQLTEQVQAKMDEYYAR